MLAGFIESVRKLDKSNILPGYARAHTHTHTHTDCTICRKEGNRGGNREKKKQEKKEWKERKSHLY